MLLSPLLLLIAIAVGTALIHLMALGFLIFFEKPMYICCERFRTLLSIGRKSRPIRRASRHS